MSSAKPAFETIQFPKRNGRPTLQTSEEVEPDPRLLKPHQVANRLGVVRAMGARPRHA